MKVVTLEKQETTLDPNYGSFLAVILLYRLEILGYMLSESKDGGRPDTPLSRMPTLSRCTDMS